MSKHNSSRTKRLNKSNQNDALARLSLFGHYVRTQFFSVSQPLQTPHYLSDDACSLDDFGAMLLRANRDIIGIARCCVIIAPLFVLYESQKIIEETKKRNPSRTDPEKNFLPQVIKN